MKHINKSVEFLKDRNYQSLKDYVYNHPDVVFEQDCDGLCLIHHCALDVNLPPSFFYVLEDLGCDFNVISKDKRTAFGIIGNDPASKFNTLNLFKYRGAKMLPEELFTFYISSAYSNRIRMEHIHSNKKNINRKGNNGYTWLHHAVIIANIKIVKELVALGADVNAVADNGQSVFDVIMYRSPSEQAYAKNYLRALGAKNTFIHEMVEVIKKRSRGIIKVLSEHPEYICWRDFNGNTLLHLALRYGCELDIVKFMVECGISPNFMNNNMQSCIFEIMNCNKDVTEYIISYTDDINMIDKFNRTSLYWALTSNNPESALLLLENGANPNIVIDGNETVLDIAYVWAGPVIARKLKNIWGAKKYSDLKKEGKVPPVSGCIEYNNLKAKDMPKLMIDGNDKIIEILKANPEFLNWRSDDGNNLLHLACLFACSKTVIKFLNKHIDVNIQNNAGQLPLHLAFKQDSDIFTFLNKKGANFNSKDKLGHTPLFQFVIEHEYDNAMALLELGADPNIVFPEKKTVLDYLIENEGEYDPFYPDLFIQDHKAKTYNELNSDL